MITSSPWCAVDTGIDQIIEDAEQIAGESALGYLYRFQDIRYSVTVDAEQESYATKQVLKLIAFPITKITSKGHIIIYYSHFRTWRFVNSTSSKQFASTTIFEALQQFIKRKDRQISICLTTINDAKALLKTAHAIKKELETNAQK